MEQEQAAGEAALKVSQTSAGDDQAPATTTGLTRRRRATDAAGRRCAESTEAGAPCPVAPMSGRTRCMMHEAKHDPQVMALVRKGQTRGGQALRVKYGLDLGDVDLSTPEGCRGALQATAKAVAAGQLSAGAAQAVVAAVRAAVAVAELELAGQVRELEAKLDALMQEAPHARR